MATTRREFLKKMTASWHLVPRVVRYPINTIGATAGIYSAIAGLTDLGVKIAVETRDLPYKEDGLAVLVSYGTDAILDTALKHPGKLFLPAYIGSIELAFEQRANIVKTAATKQDFLDVLVDDSIQNIVLFGHGSWGSWLATDELVKTNDLYKYRFHLYDAEAKKKQRRNYKTGFLKRGILVRHTCGLNQMVEKAYFKSSEKDWNEFTTIAHSLSKIVSSISNGKIKVNTGMQSSSTYEREGERESIQINYDFYTDDMTKDDKNRERVVINSPADVNLFHEQLITELTARDKPLNDNWKEKITDYINEIKKYIDKHYIVGPWENEVLGRPFYRREQIRGWAEVTTPLHFLLNPLGNK
jgi:hypothetical protein